LQLETHAAVQQADAISEVDGVNGIFFGPADIAADIGKLGQLMAPEVWSIIMPAAQKLIAKGTPVGTLVTDPSFGAELLNKGFTFVAIATDTGLLARAADAALAQTKGALK
jgi:4-hydroxy-2-oxoheptanedioate aldolase